MISNISYDELREIYPIHFELILFDKSHICGMSYYKFSSFKNVTKIVIMVNFNEDVRNLCTKFRS